MGGWREHVVRPWGSSPVVAPVFPVKSEARSSAGSEGGGGGLASLKWFFNSMIFNSNDFSIQFDFSIQMIFQFQTKQKWFVSYTLQGWWLRKGRYWALCWHSPPSLPFSYPPQWQWQASLVNESLDQFYHPLCTVPAATASRSELM